MTFGPPATYKHILKSQAQLHSPSAMDACVALLFEAAENVPVDDFASPSLFPTTDTSADMPSDAPVDFTGGVLNSAASPISLSHLSPYLKRQYGVQGQAATYLDQFCQPMFLEERLAMLFAFVLRVESNQAGALATESYKLSAELQSLLLAYALAYLVCPQAAACRGLDTAVHIADAMRESYPSMLPAADDQLRMPVVVTCINNKLTYHRNIIKSKLKTSCEKGHDVAELAYSLVGKTITACKPTLQVYLRAAFLRFLYTHYGQLEGDLFWLKADTVLAEMRAQGATKLTKIYTDDKNKYGDPANNPTHTVADVSTLPTWQLVLARHAALVQPLPAQPSAASGARKRSRTERSHMEDTNSDGDVSTTGD
ncbi:hypothetical protein C8F01DRAFT_1294574 [Mycena amicta]|nr:hypothetical protein C8F01DRAFT_1294574 [Mycena amicta]